VLGAGGPAGRRQHRGEEEGVRPGAVIGGGSPGGGGRAKPLKIILFSATKTDAVGNYCVH
jgi:hypothetical protein